MKYLFALLLLFCRSPAFAQSVDLDVRRHGCGPDGDPTHVKSEWLSDGSLQITMWDTEAREWEVVDGPASVDTSRPGAIRVFYPAKYTPIDPDRPYLSCGGWTQIKFVIRGIKRAAYKLSIERAQVDREVDVGA